jgi:hypothetical protein
MVQYDFGDRNNRLQICFNKNAASARRTAAGTPPLQKASVAASLPRHGGANPSLQRAERRSALQSVGLKVGATTPTIKMTETAFLLLRHCRMQLAAPNPLQDRPELPA